MSSRIGKPKEVEVKDEYNGETPKAYVFFFEKDGKQLKYYVPKSRCKVDAEGRCYVPEETQLWSKSKAVPVEQ